MKFRSVFTTLTIGILILPQFASAQFSADSLFPGTGTSFGRTNVTGVVSSLVGCSKNVFDVFNVFGTKSKSLIEEYVPAIDKVPTTDSDTQDKIDEGNEELKESNTREKCLDTVAYQLAKQTLAQVTQETINWINTGFEGDPFFVRDPASFFKNVANQEVKVFTDSLLNDPTSPYGSDVARAIIGNSNPRLANRFSQASGLAANATRLRSQYNLISQQITALTTESKANYEKLLTDAKTLRNNPTQYNQKLTEAENYRKTTEAKIEELKKSANDILNNEIFKLDAFEKDFSAGGWSMFLSTSINSNNNPIGASLIAGESISKKISNAVSKYQTQLDQNRGFLNQERCVDPRDYKSGGDVICRKWETVTPGSVIAEQINLSLGTSQRQLELADSINESLAGIFNALLQQLKTKGLSRIQTNMNLQFGSGSLNRVIDSYGNDITGQDLYNVVQTTGYTGTDFDIKTDIPKVISTQEEYRYEIIGGGQRPRYMCTYIKSAASKNLCLQKRTTTHSGSLSYLPEILPALGQLDYVLPGPNATFSNDLLEKVQGVTSYIELSELTLNGIQYPETENENLLAYSTASKNRLGKGYYDWEDWRMVRLRSATNELGVGPSKGTRIGRTILNTVGGIAGGIPVGNLVFDDCRRVGKNNGYGLDETCQSLQKGMEEDWRILYENFEEKKKAEIDYITRVSSEYQKYIDIKYTPLRKPTSGSGYLRDSEIAYNETAKLIYAEQSIRNATTSYNEIVEQIGLNIAYLLDIDKEVKVIIRGAMARPENKDRFNNVTACLAPYDTTVNTRNASDRTGTNNNGTGGGSTGPAGGEDTGGSNTTGNSVGAQTNTGGAASPL